MTTTEYRVHMQYRDECGTQNFTEFVQANGPDEATAIARKLLADQRGVTPFMAKAYPAKMSL